MQEIEIERRYMPFDNVEQRILPLLGGFLAKKVGKKLAQKAGGVAVDLFAKNPTGGRHREGHDDTGILKSLGVKQSGGWQSRLVKKLDEPVFDLGGGRKITVGQLAGWNTGLSSEPQNLKASRSPRRKSKRKSKRCRSSPARLSANSVWRSGRHGLFC